MSRWLPERLRPARSALVGLDGQSAVWQLAGAKGDEPAAHAPAALAAASAARQWNLVAGLDLAAHWVQMPPPGLRSLDELRQVAAARCAQLHGGHPTDWCIAADWDARYPFVCAALPQAALAPWLAAARAARVRVRCVTTWAAACAARRRSTPANGWSGLSTTSRVIVWHCSGGRVDHVFGLHSAAGSSGASMADRTAQQIRLASLRHPQLAEGPVHWIALAQADAPATEADTALCWGALSAEALA